MAGVIIAGRGTAAYADNSGRYTLNVRHAVTSGDRRHYVWEVWAEGERLSHGGGLSGRNAQPVEMLGALVVFLAGDGERYHLAVHGQLDGNGWNFCPVVAEWAYSVVDELHDAADEISARVRR